MRNIGICMSVHLSFSRFYANEQKFIRTNDHIGSHTYQIIQFLWQYSILYTCCSNIFCMDRKYELYVHRHASLLSTMMTRWYDEKIAYIVWCVAHMHIHKTKGLLWGSIILICVDRTYRFLVGFLFVFDSLFFPRHKPCMQIYFYTCITYIKTKDAAIPFVIILSSMCACAYNKIWLVMFRCCYCRSNCRCPVHVDMLLIVLWMSLIENSLASQSSFFSRLLLAFKEP